VTEVEDEWADHVDDPVPALSAEADAAEEPRPVYGSLNDFVRDYLRVVYAREIDGERRVWAAQWWNYPEGSVRLMALWRAWELLRRDPATGLSVWLRDHADHHMPILMSPEGPFSSAKVRESQNKCGRGQPLPHEDAPDGLLDGL
jgi:hypothetical protein